MHIAYVLILSISNSPEILNFSDLFFIQRCRIFQLNDSSLSLNFWIFVIDVIFDSTQPYDTIV